MLSSQEDQSRFNQKQYDILKRCSKKRNIAEWNSYRAEQPEISIDLQNADLTGARLEGAKLSEADLEGARFVGADLLAADLRKANLRRANLEKANLWGASLSEANLEGACLVSANLENADLRKTNLEKAHLRGANLEGAIAETATEGRLPDSHEKVEVIISLADDITYEEFVNLLKCLESSSLIVEGSHPHLNEIRIHQHIEKPVAGEGTKAGNKISISLSKNFAEILYELFLFGIEAGQVQNEGTDADTGMGAKSAEGCDRFREFLKNACVSGNERNSIFPNLMLSNMEESRFIEDFQAIANLVECGRIHFQA